MIQSLFAQWSVISPPFSCSGPQTQEPSFPLVACSGSLLHAIVSSHHSSSAQDGSNNFLIDFPLAFPTLKLEGFTGVNYLISIINPWKEGVSLTPHYSWWAKEMQVSRLISTDFAHVSWNTQGSTLQTPWCSMHLSLDCKVQILEKHNATTCGSHPQGFKPWVHRIDHIPFGEAQSQDKCWAISAQLHWN